MNTFKLSFKSVYDIFLMFCIKYIWIKIKIYRFDYIFTRSFAHNSGRKKDNSTKFGDFSWKCIGICLKSKVWVWILCYCHDNTFLEVRLKKIEYSKTAMTLLWRYFSISKWFCNFVRNCTLVPKLNKNRIVHVPMATHSWKSTCAKWGHPTR